jgi:hypothetical protein
MGQKIVIFSVENEHESQPDQIQYETDRWAQCIFKGTNCTMCPALRMWLFFMQIRREARKIVTQFVANSFSNSS